jgi:DNA adenine methylase
MTLAFSVPVLPSQARLRADASGPGAEPFLKWVGGKRRLLPTLRSFLPSDLRTRRYVEPFLGGGAMFFALRPQHAAISDLNFDLVETYRVVRDETEDLVDRLDQLERAHSADAFYAARDRYNARPRIRAFERAALFIYLNKTCFNGLYRVNRAGLFNAPIGRYAKPCIVDAPRLRAAAAALRDVDLRCAGFSDTLERISEGDFVYLDPPYVPLSRTKSFVAYDAAGFTQDDQVRLAVTFRELHRRGAKVMMSNADAPLVHALYEGFDIQRVLAPRAINSRATHRGPVCELVVRNYASSAQLAVAV